MTRDDIIRMAREAGFYIDQDWIDHGLPGFERFAAIVAAAERSACAQVCDDTAPRQWQRLTDEELDQAMDYWSDPSRSAYGGADRANGEYVDMKETWRYIEATLKEKNT